MQAGKLNRKVVVEAPSSSQDSAGQPVNTWAAVHSCQAAIGALSGREVFALGAGFAGQLTHKVTIRFTSKPIATGMRVRYGARTFLIQTPPQNPEEANVQLDLFCLEQS